MIFRSNTKKPEDGQDNPSSGFQKKELNAGGYILTAV
jgi:hypothetical protein